MMAFCSSGILAARAHAQSEDPKAASQFVSRKGTAFVLSGREFPVAGANNHYLPYGSPREVTAVLDAAVAMNANVMRTFLQPVIGSKDGKSVPTVWNFKSKADSSELGVKGTYYLFWDTNTNAMGFNDGPDGLQKFDFVIAEAGKRGLRLLVALLDFWDYTGGSQQMRAWYGSADKATFFAKDPRARRDYKAWAEHVLNRVNSITGVRYKDDPTIFAWELMNEPNLEPTEALREWVVEMSAFVKSIDKNHLVGTGHGNIYDEFSDLEIATIDFGTWHGYPIHWGLTPEEINSKIGHFCGIARKAAKPMLWEEFGHSRSNPDQAAIYSMWLSTLHANPDCAGWLVWRLVAEQDDGVLPPFHSDGFDIHRDSGQVWRVLAGEARKLRARAGAIR